jgi:hypothetical protein
MAGPSLELECPFCQESFHQVAREITVKGSRTCPLCERRIEFTGSYLFRVLREMEALPPRFRGKPPEERSRV